MHKIFCSAKMKIQELAKISSMITEAISLYNADKTGMIGNKSIIGYINR